MSARKCVCGYEAEDQQDLDDHILAMARAESEEWEHREARR